MDLVRQGSDISEKASQKIMMGRITGVYGVKGWVKVFSYADPMESIVDYNPWYIRPQSRKSVKSLSVRSLPDNQKSSPWTKVKITAGKRHAKTVLAKFEHCNNRDEAQLYIGSEIAIEQNQLETLSDTDGYYWRDLLGLHVINQQDIELGVVTNILETGANDVLVVTAENVTEVGIKEHLIPWTMHLAIVAVDLEQGVVEVDWDADF